MLVRELPSALAPLRALASDLRWTWSHAGDALWTRMDADIWASTRNPYAVLQNLSQQRLEQLATDSHFQQQLQHLLQVSQDYQQREGWGERRCHELGLKTIAYFSLEFGLGEALPLYAGGLGILAGDYLKTASDLGVPVVGIGLLYQEGYFRQVLDNVGWQQAVYTYNDPTGLAVAPVLADSGAWLHVAIDFLGRRVRFRVWQVRVGRVMLYLLDSNDPLNSPADRGITSKLYGGGQRLRLAQEIALGVGGWRVLDALGLAVDICHLNEGHAAFVTLERARSCLEKRQKTTADRGDFWDALWATRAGNVFTTHTPVAAAFDTYSPELLTEFAGDYAQEVGIDPAQLMALGRQQAGDRDEPFNMAYLAARTCLFTNAVSQRHGEVSRHIFQVLYPRWPSREVPVTHITNGVHMPSWDSPWADTAWTDACGKDRWRREPSRLADDFRQTLSDQTLWALRGQERTDLVHYARARLRRQLGQRGVDREALERAHTVLDPQVLTLGFARRFTDYKRPNLLLHDRARLSRLLNDQQRPVQLMVAGKAHPDDEAGKRFIQQWVGFVNQPEVRDHAVFLEDYDMALAQELVQGVDVWINTPRPPWEACGTSGMKVLVNGGLNLSALDGWWAEAYTDAVGWALTDPQNIPAADADAIVAEQLYALLEQAVIPLFYQRDANGLPTAWIARIRASMAQLTPQFASNRMLLEYLETLYCPALKHYQRRTAKGADRAKVLKRWHEHLTRHWHEVGFGPPDWQQTAQGWRFEIAVYLGHISPDSVKVQLYAEPLEGVGLCCEDLQKDQSLAGATNAYRYRGEIVTQRSVDDFTPRIIAYHPDAQLPTEAPFIHWPLTSS